MCPDGFLLGSDWKTCQDVDECENDSMGCHQLCINTPGSYEAMKIFQIDLKASSHRIKCGASFNFVISKY